MRSPSGRVLANRVDAYRAIPGQDTGGGYHPSYPGISDMAQLPCSVQYTGTGEDVVTYNRITVVNMYDVIFGSDPRLNPRDRLVWTDISPNRTLMVQANPLSEAGRGAAGLAGSSSVLLFHIGANYSFLSSLV